MLQHDPSHIDIGVACQRHVNVGVHFGIGFCKRDGCGALIARHLVAGMVSLCQSGQGQSKCFTKTLWM